MGAIFGQAAGYVVRVVRDDASAAGTSIARATVWDFFVFEPSTRGVWKIEVFLIIHADRIVLCIPRAGSSGRHNNVLIAPLLRRWICMWKCLFGENGRF
jgi:hypothetical protein